MQRSQSDRAKRAATNVRQAASDWKSMSRHLLDRTRLDANWETLDHYARKVDEQIDLLVNYTAGDGFIYRQSARATVARDINLNIVGTVLALLLSGMVAWALTSRIVKPVAAASSVAEHIAGGKLDVAIPKGSADELGDLLASMKVMRDNIKTMMDREVAQRRTAQARLADALESSQEGVVVVDADDRIALANAQAASFLSVAPELLLKAGRPLVPALAGIAAFDRRGTDPAAAKATANRKKSGSPTDAGCASARARPATAASSSFAATSASRKSRRPTCARPICGSTPRSTTCRRAFACSTRRTGSRWSTAASTRFSGCRAT